MGKISWFKVARRFMKSAKIPLPITDTVIDILKLVITEEQAAFILQLKKQSYNSEELLDAVDLKGEALDKMLNDLMHIGAVTGIASRSTGIMVYRVAPFFPGMLEFTLMRGESGDLQKKLARKWEDYFGEMVEGTQLNYDTIIPNFRSATASIDRIVPVETSIDPVEEVVLPYDELSKIIEETSTVALATCYCRHRKDLIDEPCKVTKNRKNCFGLGRAAEFLISQDFAQKISKEEALKIFKQAEDDGLIHKAFHNALDPTREIEGICSCCACCCGTFDAHYKGAIPLMSLTSYIARIDSESCAGCGTCIDFCQARAITLEDAIATINDERCLGCAVCAHHCPEEAINMERTERRPVFIPPPKISSN